MMWDYHIEDDNLVVWVEGSFTR